MAVLLKGSEVVAAMKEKMLAQVAELESKGVSPCLGIVRIGSRPDDIAYERGAVKRCEGIGVKCKVYVFPESIDSCDFLGEFKKINEDSSVHGILLFRPMPRQINEDDVRKLINPLKDIDCFSPVNTAKVFAGDETGFAPCTPEAVLEILDYYGIPVQGKQVTVVGRSMVVGKPLSMLLLKRHATITVCHTKTLDIEAVCRRAEIVIVAVGKAKMVNGSFIAEGCIVIDVGTNVGADGNLYGDVDFADVSPKASMITPVPGGVGTVTTSVLVKHVIRAAASL